VPNEHAENTGTRKRRQVSGLVSLLLALVLGTLIGVSFAYYSTQKANLETFSAQILRLDQALLLTGKRTGNFKGNESFSIKTIDRMPFIPMT
jgi:hypothetical protein